MRSTAVSLLAAAALLSACDSGTGPGGTVAIRFGTAPGITASRTGGALFAVAGQAQQGLVIDGDNGALDISRIAVIVEEFELEPVEVADCDDVSPEPPECEDFEVKFLFIDIPLDGSEVTVVNQAVPAGFYKELEFEIDELEIDDDDADDLAEADIILALLDRIRTQEGFPSWPSKASMAVVGTFTPKDANGTLGQPVAFTTFIRAEIEVELEPPTPFEVTDGNAVSIMVNIRPDLWFKVGTNVLNLAALQNSLIELEVEIEDGFEIEIEH